LLLVFVPGVYVVPLRAGVAFAMPFVLLAPALVLSRRLAEEVWYDQGPTFDPGDDEVDEAPTDSLLFRLGRPFLPDDVLTVCSLTVRNGLRTPVALSYALLPLFGLVFTWLEASSTETAAVALPGTAVFLGAMAVGLLFTLNPLGVDVVALPWLLTTQLSGRDYVLGKIAAGLLAGLPLVGGLTIASLAFVGATGPQVVFTTAVYGMVAVCTAPVIAVGLGVAFPQLDQTTKIRGQRKTLPGKKALTAYFVVVFVGGVPGLTASFVSLNGQFQVSLVQTVSLLFVSAVVLGTAAAVGYRFAVDTVNAYQIET